MKSAINFIYSKVIERKLRASKLGYEPNLKPEGEQLKVKRVGLVAQVVRALH